MAVEVEVSYMLSYQIAYLQGKGDVPNKEASMGKLFGSEVQQRASKISMDILGLYGQLRGDSAPLKGAAPDRYMGTVSSTIAAGTSEIQRGIIAGRGLGLPRGT